MAKDLPYFKFIATEWLTGSIVYETLELQGLFINICALYWQREGVLSLSEVEYRYKRKAQIAKLTDRFFSVNDGFILIDFLNEQLVERQYVSKKNSNNGKLGGRPTLEKNKAKKSNIEEEVKEEKKEEKRQDSFFLQFWNMYDKKVGVKECEAKFSKLSQEVKEKILLHVPQYVRSTPDKTYRKNPSTYLNGKHWESEIISNTPPPKSTYVVPDRSDYNPEVKLIPGMRGWK